jgi:hypothetical protein
MGLFYPRLRNSSQIISVTPYSTQAVTVVPLEQHLYSKPKIHHPPSLPIPPIRKLRHQRPIAHHQVLRQVIVGIHNEKIGCRTVPPLETQIQVDVFGLVVELDKIGKKQLVSQSQINPRTNQPKIPIGIF